MPELPEVDHAVRRLSRWTKGQIIEEARALDELVVADGDAFAGLRGATVIEIIRRGKNAVVRLDQGGEPKALWFHLGMTGHLKQLPRSTALTEVALPKFSRFAFAVKDSVVALTDMRRMGRAAAGPRAAIESKHLANLGFEATESTPDKLGVALDTAQVLKAALMDQARIAGLGNIHAAEALFLAKLHPERPARSLTGAELSRLSDAIREALTRAMVSEDEELAYIGEGGPNIFFVYGREGEPCSNCKTEIVREVTRGRSTFLCPECQAMKRLSASAAPKAPAKAISKRRKP
jgi:formamidopyrimidine-DNA glycosylase